MKEKNHIDKLAQNVAASKQFAFNPNDWASAQAYIRTQKAAKARKKMAIIGSSVVVLIALLAFFLQLEPKANGILYANNHIGNKDETVSGSLAGVNHFHQQNNLPSDREKQEKNTELNLKDGRVANSQLLHNELKLKTELSNHNLSGHVNISSRENPNVRLNRNRKGRIAVYFEPKFKPIPTSTNNKGENMDYDLRSSLSFALANSHQNQADSQLQKGEDKNVGAVSNKQKHYNSNGLSELADSLINDSTETQTLTAENEKRKSKDVNKDSLDFELAPIRPWLIVPFFGMTYSLNELSGSNINLISKRNDEEANAYSPDFGLSLQIPLKKRFYLRTGLGMFQYGENAKYNDFSITTYERFTYQEVDYVTDNSYLEVTDSMKDGSQWINTDYQWVSQFDTTFKTKLDSQTNVKTQKGLAFNNRYKYLEIPIAFGYEFPIGKWTLGLDAGTSLNLLVAAQTTYPDLKTAEYQNQSASQYKFLNYGFVSSFSIGRAIKGPWAFECSWKYRTQLQPIRNENLHVEGRYQTIGMQTRFVYKF